MLSSVDEAKDREALGIELGAEASGGSACRPKRPPHAGVACTCGDATAPAQNDATCRGASETDSSGNSTARDQHIACSAEDCIIGTSDTAFILMESDRQLRQLVHIAALCGLLLAAYAVRSRFK